MCAIITSIFFFSFLISRNPPFLFEMKHLSQILEITSEHFWKHVFVHGKKLSLIIWYKYLKIKCSNSYRNEVLWYFESLCLQKQVIWGITAILDTFFFFLARLFVIGGIYESFPERSTKLPSIILWCLLTPNFLSYPASALCVSHLLPKTQADFQLHHEDWPVITIFLVNTLAPCFLFMGCNCIKPVLNFLRFV